MIYQTEQIEFNKDILNIFGVYNETPNSIIFNIIIQYPKLHKNGVIYKTWSRKKFGHFDPSEISDSDPRIIKVVQQFQKMGQNRFENRFKTLLYTRPTIDAS